jgi:hypothetical protein
MQIRRGAPGIDRKYLDRPFKMSEQEIIRRGTALARLLCSLLKGAGGAMLPDTLAAIEGQIVDVVLGMVPSNDIAEPLHRRARVAMNLRDILLGHLEAPVNVSAMCETLGVCQRIRQVFRYRRRAPRESGGNRPRQPVVVEGEGPTENPDVVEVLHPAIGPPERHHRLKFLGNDGLSRIAPQPGHGKVQHGRIVQFFGTRLQPSPKPMSIVRLIRARADRGRRSAA